MGEGQQPTAEEMEIDGASAAGDPASALGRLPEGVIDETPLEDFDEQTFLHSISEDDQRPRFGAEADAEAVGLAIGEAEAETETESAADAAPQEEPAGELAMLEAPAIEVPAEFVEEFAESVEEFGDSVAELADAPTEGLDLGLDELDLAAIEEMAEEAAPMLGADSDSDGTQGHAAAEPAPKLPKFMFDVSFDLPDPHGRAKPEPVPEPEPEPEPEVPPPPTFSEEEMAAARQAGYADGQAAGYHEAMQSLEAKIASGVDAVGMFLPDLLGQRDRLNLALANDAARLAHALVRRALPELNRRYGPLEIEAVVKEAIQTAIDQPRIHIRVAPEIAERIMAPVEAAAQTSGYAGRVTVVGDPLLGPADVKLEWGDGGVDRMAEQVWANLTALVARLVEGLEADTGLTSVAVGSAA